MGFGSPKDHRWIKLVAFFARHRSRTQRLPMNSTASQGVDDPDDRICLNEPVNCPYSLPFGSDMILSRISSGHFPAPLSISLFWIGGKKIAAKAASSNC